MIMYVIPFLLWAFLITALSIANGETYESFISRTIPDLCPYSTFCTQGPTKRLTAKYNTPCCTPCSCKEDCWLYDNCCLDHFSHHTPSQKSFIKCMIPIQFSSDEEASSEYLVKTSVYTVTSCPADYPDDDVSKMCTGSKTIDDLRDQATVSDRTGRVYRNQYCAKCHGKRDVKVWEQALACQKLTDGLIESIITLDPDAMRNGECVLFSVAPASDKLVQRNRCYLYEYQTCNETGRWSTYNEHIERACAAYTGSYGQFRLKTGTTWFKNPYCYLCNMKDGDGVESMCPKEGSGIRVGVYAMTGLLTTRRNRTSRQSTICKNGEVYDKYFESCRILHCPIGQAAIDGRCYDMFKDVEGIEMSAAFLFTMESTNHDASMDTILTDSDNLQQINVLLLTSLKVDLTACYTCPNFIIHDTVHSDSFLVYAALRSTKSCTINTTLDIFHGAYRDGVTFTLTHEGKPLVFTGKLAFDKHVPMTDIMNYRGSERDRYTWKRVSWRSTQGQCFRSSVLKDFFYCPYVDLSWSEYHHLMNDTTNMIDADHFMMVNRDTGHAVTNGSHGNSKASVYRVCARNYIRDRVNGVTKVAGSSFLLGVVVLLTFVTAKSD